MKTHRQTLKNLACLGAVTFLLNGFAVTCTGQEEKPQPLTHVTFVQVKPDMVEEYQRLLKEELIPAYKKTDIPWISAWQVWPTVTGRNSHLPRRLRISRSSTVRIR